MNKLQGLREIELLDSTPIPKAIHSRLYNLIPVGLGTPYVESLTSYTVRLAHAHMTFPGRLVKHEIFPEFSLSDRYFKNNTIWKNSKTLNSNGEWAREWAVIMQKLTSRADLIFLTLYPYSNVLPSMALTRKKLSWCPYCYEEWKEKKTIIYNPLLWHIYGLEICGLHQKPLQARCAQCQKGQGIMVSQACIGYCQHCGEWLGKTEDIRNSGISWEWQNWIVSQLGDLLARMPELQEIPLLDDISRKHFTKLPKITEGNKALLAREFSVSNKALNQWIKGESLPQLGNLLKICCRLDISIFDWLTKETFDLDFAINAYQTIPLPGKKVNRSPANKEKIKRLLFAVGESRIDPPMTINELAEILDYSAHYLGQNYPEPCELIKGNYQIYKSRKSQERLENLRNEIKELVFDLDAKGINPSQSKIQNTIGKPAIFKSPDARQFYDEAIAELKGQELD